MISFRVHGLSKLQLAFDAIRFRYNRGYRIGLEKAVQYVLAESQKIVPVDTGFLRSTGYYELSGDGFRTKANVGYRAYYAVWVHEDLTKYHKPGTSAKFITKVTNDKKVKERIVRIIRNEMKKRA